MNKVNKGISVVCCIIIPVTHPYLLPPSNPQFQLILLLPSFFLCSFMSPIPYSVYPYLMPWSLFGVHLILVWPTTLEPTQTILLSSLFSCPVSWLVTISIRVGELNTTHSFTHLLYCWVDILSPIILHTSDPIQSKTKSTDQQQVCRHDVLPSVDSELE